MSERSNPGHNVAISLDRDGVIYSKFPPFQVKPLVAIIRRRDYITNSPAIPKFVDRRMAFSPLRSKNHKLIYVLSKNMGLRNGVREFIVKKFHEGADIFMNTGQPSQADVVKAVKESLMKENIFDLFKGFFFKPGANGLWSAISKAVAIQELKDMGYEKIFHYDDNHEDAFIIAKVHPDVEVIIVEDFSTKLMVGRDLLEKFPNVKIIKRLDAKAC